jgi:hypothetical protein
MVMNIGFVSTRLAGTDGVTLETIKWARICRDLGHNVFFCAARPQVIMQNRESHTHSNN